MGETLEPLQRPLVISSQAMISTEKNDARILIGWHIVDKTWIPPKSRLNVSPEALPGHVLAAQEIGVQGLQERIVNRERPNAFRGNNVRIRGSTQDGFEERIAAA